MNIPRAAQKALEPNETVQWVGQPARMPKLLRWFFYLFYGMFGIFAFATLIQVGVPFLKGEIPMMEGEPVTFKRAWPPTLIFVVSLGGFWFLFRWNFGKYRYVVTDRRAFHCRPIWGGSWIWSPGDGFERDYDDPESSPISGGYFTQETVVTRSGSDKCGKIEIGPLNSTMDDAKAISGIISAIPVLEDIMYDPSNLDFFEVENPKMVETEINSVLKKFKKRQAYKPS